MDAYDIEEASDFKTVTKRHRLDDPLLTRLIQQDEERGQSQPPKKAVWSWI
jgi:hypothetical protein